MNTERKTTTLLFNPFVYMAGGKALLLGVAAILLAGGIGSISHTHFDGVLDTHVGLVAPLWVYLAEGVIDWLSLFLILGIVGLMASKTKFRWIDLLGTQALARWPTVLMALISLPPAYHRFTEQLLKQLQNPKGPSPTISGMDGAIFLAVTLGLLLLTIWMVCLMYRAFSVSCNLRGGKAIALFAAGLLVAEVLSKVLVGQLFRLM